MLHIKFIKFFSTKDTRTLQIKFISICVPFYLYGKYQKW